MDRFKNVPERMNGSDFIANPESTLLDLDGYSFESQLSLDSVNWDEADQEVDDVLNDIDSSTDDESSSSSGSSSSDDEDSNDDDKSIKSDNDDDDISDDDNIEK